MKPIICKVFFYCFILLSWQPLWAQGNSASVICESVSSIEIAFPKSPEEVEDFILRNEDNINLIRVLPTEVFEGLRRVTNDGRQNLATYGASYRGEEVFIKVTPNAIREALWMQYLNPKGLGPKVFGIMYISGQIGVVMKKRPGYNSKAWLGYTQLPQDFMLTASMIDEMKRQATLLYNAGFINRDPQFLLDPSEVTMIDFELLRSASRHLRSQNIHRVLEDIDTHIIEKWRDMRRLQFPSPKR